MSELTVQMQRELAEIREQYSKGRMDAEMVAELAEMAIDAELGKPDGEINGAWLDACAELMNDVNKEKLAHVPDRHEDTWQAIHEEIRRLEKRRCPAWVKPAIRVAACLVLLLGVGLVLPFAGIRGLQEQDGQAHRPGSYETILVTEAKAEDTPLPPPAACQTADFSEVVSYLGFMPALPAWVPDGWRAQSYAAERGDGEWYFSAHYVKEGEEAPLRYEVMWQSDVDSLNSGLPQDESGAYRTLDGGLTVYLTTDANQPLAAWTADNRVIRYSGPLAEEDLLRSVMSIP